MPNDDARGWQWVDELVVSSGELSISDTSYFYDEPVLVRVQNGRYAVYVEIAERDGEPFVRSLRVCSEDGLARGQRIGGVLVDFGQIGVCDRGAVAAEFTQLEDAGMPIYYEKLNTTYLSGVVMLPHGTKMAVIRPGFGDGNYTVFSLVNASGELRGVEVDCEHSGP